MQPTDPPVYCLSMTEMMGVRNCLPGYKLDVPCDAIDPGISEPARIYQSKLYPDPTSVVHGDLPKGAPHGARGRVAPLGNGADHSRRGRALPQTPWDALKRHNSRDTTLV